MSEDVWSKVSLRKAMAQEVNKFLQTDQAKKHGLTNLTQFVDVAIRETVQKYGVARFEHFSIDGDFIKLIDNNCPNGIPHIEITINEKDLYCKTCKSDGCIHITTSWNQNEIKKNLESRGIVNIWIES